MKAAKPGEPLDAPPEVWAEINETLDAEAEEYKASLKKALDALPPEDGARVVKKAAKKGRRKSA